MQSGLLREPVVHAVLHALRTQCMFCSPAHTHISVSVQEERTERVLGSFVDLLYLQCCMHSPGNQHMLPITGPLEGSMGEWQQALDRTWRTAMKTGVETPSFSRLRGFYVRPDTPCLLWPYHCTCICELHGAGAQLASPGLSSGVQVCKPRSTVLH